MIIPSKRMTTVIYLLELLKAVYHKEIQGGATWFRLSQDILLHMCEVIIFEDEAYLKILETFEFIFQLLYSDSCVIINFSGTP